MLNLIYYIYTRYHDISMHASPSTTLPSPSPSTTDLTLTPPTLERPKPENISSSATSTNTAGYQTTPGFTSLYNSRVKNLSGVRFSDLLRDVAAVDPEMRIRFTSPHPKVSTDTLNLLPLFNTSDIYILYTILYSYVCICHRTSLLMS